MARPTKQELDDRRKAFEVYRDMGKLRSYDRLQIALEPTHGFVAINRIQKWAKIDQWQARIAEYDKLLDPNDELAAIETVADFDKMDMLARAAYLGLSRALASHPHATTPAEFKALVDASEKAIRCMERLHALGMGGKAKPAELTDVVNRAAKLFELVEQATREKFAAAGTPVKDHGPIIDVTPTKVMALPAPREQPMESVVSGSPEPIGQKPVVSTPVENPSSGESPPVYKTMAERLAATRSK